jgi:hypothetical protein
MCEAKVEFTIGSVKFSSEGDKEWVAEQLDKILKQAPELLKVVPTNQTEEKPKKTNQPKTQTTTESTKTSTSSNKTLPSFLDEKNSKTNQLKKFLATAIWHHDKGKTRITTRDVTSALKKSNQSRLSNASDCLNKNVAKGFCEKDGSEFFVTDEGRDSV